MFAEHYGKEPRNIITMVIDPDPLAGPTGKTVAEKQKQMINFAVRSTLIIA